MVRTRVRKVGLVSAAVLVATVAASCASGAPAAELPSAAGQSASITSMPTPRSAPTTAPAVGHGALVVLDPGHNGGNSGDPSAINRLVPAGRGQQKACNTTGTATDAGYSEHAFNWDVATRVKADLLARGFAVVLTRDNDNGVGPCVNQRAAIGNQHKAAAVVAIHADGAPARDHGFDVEYSTPPLNAAQGAPSIRLATALRDAVRGAGFELSNYLGTAGLYPRADLAGLNLSERPTALIECGNMRNSADAATQTSVTGRQRYADAIAAGIIAYLAGAEH